MIRRSGWVAIGVIAMLAAACSGDGTGDPSTPPCTPAEEAGTSLRTITAGGITREYQLAVPEDTPRGIIFDFHGAGSDIAQHDDVTRMSVSGTARGYVVVTPQATGAPAHWTVPGLPGPDDIAFVEDVEGLVREAACVEGPSIATGFSAGASMSTQLACESDRFSIIAPVAGISLQRRCGTGAPIATISYHGTADPLVPYVGPDGWEAIEEETDVFFVGDVEASVAAFAERAGCSSEITERDLGDDTTIIAYDCPGVPVELFRIHGGGHTHPGEHALGEYLENGTASTFGPTTITFDGTDEMLDFFDRVIGSGA